MEQLENYENVEQSEPTPPATPKKAFDQKDRTAAIITAYVQHNNISPNDLPKLIREVHDALEGRDSEDEKVIQIRPPVPIAKSVTPDYIICLEDGKKFKSLKRHLRTHYNLSPEEYKEKWNLPHDYPMVAPNYAAMRQQLAKRMGLGRKATAFEEVEEEALPPSRKKTTSRRKAAMKPANDEISHNEEEEENEE